MTWNPNVFSCSYIFTQQASEGNSGRQCSKIDEDDGGDALHVQGIFKVAHVVRVAPANVVDQASERDP